MTSLPDAIRKAADQRIEAAREATTATGTVTTRDTTGSRAMVVFDGDSLAVPVKVLGSVDAFAGDRVVLQRFGSDWTVTGTFTQRGPSRASTAGLLSTGTNTSASYADLPGVAIASFVKRYTGTTIRIEMTGTAYCGGAGSTTATFGVRINGVDYDIAELGMDAVSTSFSIASTGFVAAGLAAATYTVQGRWKRSSGTGTVTTDNSLWQALTATEVW